jgi:hypothetical protein
MKEDFCCDKFAEQAGHLQVPSGGGFLYPPEMVPDTQFEIEEDGTWNINGCCGGGCFVVTEMRYCPYCGASLAEHRPKEKKA